MNKPKSKFWLAPDMPLARRYALVAVAALLGFTLQVYVNLFVGFVGLILGMLLCLVRGIDNAPQIADSGNWETVTVAEFEKAIALLHSTEEFNSKAGGFSCSTPKGCGGCLLIGAAIGIAGLWGMELIAIGSQYLAPLSQGGSMAIVFIADALVFLAPIWKSGSIKTWEPPNLRTTLDQFSMIYSETKSKPELEISPSLLIVKSATGHVPIDCKLNIKPSSADTDFMGIQVQTSFNSVQGTNYPYTYCVLVAKPEFRLLEKAKPAVETPPAGGFRTGRFSDSNEKKESRFSRFHDALVEPKKQKDMEIIVVRQNTKGRGYTTSPLEAYKIFTDAYNLLLSIK